MLNSSSSNVFGKFVLIVYPTFFRKYWHCNGHSWTGIPCLCTLWFSMETTNWYSILKKSHTLRIHCFVEHFNAAFEISTFDRWKIVSCWFVPFFLKFKILAKSITLAYTLYYIILCIARNFLETRENIKILTHPFYHINLDWFSWE